MAELAYPIVVTPLAEEDGGGFAAFAPDLLGCMGNGTTQAEAIADVEAAIGEWLDEAGRLGRKVPEPGSAGKRASQELKNLRELALRQDDVLRVQDEALNVARSELERYRAVAAVSGHESEYASNWAEKGAFLIASIPTKAGDEIRPHQPPSSATSRSS